MGFTETRLNLGVPPSSGGPGFRTKSIKVGAGFERRICARTQSLFQGDIGKVLLNETEIAYVIAFFNARKGRAIGFRYKYWGDYTCTQAPLIIDGFTTTQGVAVPAEDDTTGTVYQLQKRYSHFGVDSYKTIYKPVEDTVTIYINGVEAAYAVNSITGQVTFDDPPANNALITWSGEFDLPVRFDSDKLPGVTELIDPSTNQVWLRFDSLPIVETIETVPIMPAIVPRLACAPTVGLTAAPLRLEIPCTSDADDDDICNCTSKAGNSAVMQGVAGQTYQIQLRFRGVVETNPYRQGTADGYFYAAGEPDPDDDNGLYRLIISNPNATYYLNHAEGDSECVGIDYTRTVTIQEGAVVTLSADSVNKRQHKNQAAIVVAGIPPAPQPYNGQFVQMDVVSVT